MTFPPTSSPTTIESLFPANRRLFAEMGSLGGRMDARQAPEGLLAPSEGLCLYVLARRAAALGNVVEIGSYRGRSTWFLARALADVGSPFRVVSIDPHLEGTRDAFLENLARTGVAGRVDSRLSYAHDVAGGFDEPVGLLWIDGDHSYRGVREDFEDWFPKLAEGGWVVLHDTVSSWYGPTRLARELLRRRDDLDQVGLVKLTLYARKTAPRARNRVRTLAASAPYELATLAWSRHTRFRALNHAPGEP